MNSLAAEGFLSIGQMQLEYCLFGQHLADAPMVVMLHEGLGSVQTWGEFPSMLAQATGARVFAYSRDGYGSSPVSQKQLPVDYIRDHAANVLPRVLERIGFERGILLGHSDGASMCAAYAGASQDPRLCGLVLMAPHFMVEAETLAEIRIAREAYVNGTLRQRLARYHKNVDAAFMRWNDVWLRPEFADFNLRSEVAAIRVPMLVLRGEEDKYGTRRQVTFAEQTNPNVTTTLILPGCGHVPHREKRAETIEAIVAFCAPLLETA